MSQDEITVARYVEYWADGKLVLHLERVSGM
jgi:hypothetical protein